MLAEARQARGPESALRDALVQKLMRFARQLVTEDERRRAEHRFYGPAGPPGPDELERLAGNHAELLEITFAEWLLHDFRLSDGATVIERFVARRGWTLSPDERAHLEKSRASVLSLYEVAEVRPEEGFVLEDVFRGGRVSVRERLLTRSLVRWDVIGLRLIEVDGALVVSGGVIPFGRREKEELLDGLAREYERYRGDHPGASKDEFLDTRGEWLQQFALRRHSRPPPELWTSDGDPLRFCRSTYRVRDREALLAALRAHPDLEEVEPGRFTWHGETEGGTPRSSGLQISTRAGDLLDPAASYLVLGHAEVKRRRLVLETRSEPRNGRLRALVEDVAGGCVKHLADTVEDPWTALEAADSEPAGARGPGAGPDGPRRTRRPRGEALPADLEAHLVREFYDQHFRAWLDESIPALEGRTPREAARSRRGRERLVELLRDIENMHARDRLDGGADYEPGWLWDELGLDGSRGGPS